jgi:hypothetical protein
MMKSDESSDKLRYPQYRNEQTASNPNDAARNAAFIWIGFGSVHAGVSGFQESIIDDQLSQNVCNQSMSDIVI